MSAEILSQEQQPHEVVDILVRAIDLYWENLLEFPQNTIRITSRDAQADGSIIQKTVTIQRFYETAYFVKYQRSQLEFLGRNGPVLNNPLSTLEFRMQPSLFDKGAISIRQISPTGIAIESEIPLDGLKQVEPQALEALRHLQLDLLALLIGHSKVVGFFDPLPVQVKQLLEQAYGEEVAKELWNAGMTDDPQD